jgi:membrane fusion protein (multidrug efflux system)
VTIRTVITGRRIDSFWIIESGLAPGDRVVTDGLVKAQDGGTVIPKAEPVKPQQLRNN